MFKGISSILASFLLIIITVSLSALVYYEIISIETEIKERTGTPVEKEINLALTKLKIQDFGNCKIVVLNIGETDVPLEDIYIYKADIDSEIFEEVNFSPSTGTIKKSENLEINFINVSPGYYKLTLKVFDKTMDFGFITCSPFSCKIKPNCGSKETPIVALSDITNARVELPTEGNYYYKLCCSDVSSVTYTNNPGACESLGFTGLITLATNSTFTLNTNSRVEKYNYTNLDGFDYKKNICINLTTGNLDCIYDTKSNCNAQGYNQYIISISGETNARVGNEASYPLVLCCK
jgi:hypothetical protein